MLGCIHLMCNRPLFFPRHSKNKIAVLQAARQNRNKTRMMSEFRKQTSPNMERIGGKVAATVLKVHESLQVQKTASRTRTSQGPYKKTPDCFCSLLNNSNQYFMDS